MSDSENSFIQSHKKDKEFVDFEDTPLIINDEDDEGLNWSRVKQNFTWPVIKKRATYYIPILGWLPSYTRSDLFYDVLAGLTVSCVMIPQGLGLALLARLSPIYGLYTCFAPLVVYGFLGTSRHLSVGPEAVVSLMTGQTLGKITADVTLYPELAHTLAFFVGIFTFVGGLFRLGFMDSILSKAMATGFVTAVAFVIMIEQLPGLLGITAHIDEDVSTIEKLIQIFQNIATANWITCVLGLVSLALLFIFNSFLKPKFANNLFFKYFPFILFLVICNILITMFLRLDEQGVVILGKIEGGFQTPAKFSFFHTGDMITNALLIFIIGFIESVVCAKKFADKNGYEISTNRELVALGTSNIFGGLFGAYPAFGALSRTNLNDNIGGRTQISSLISAVVISFTILFLLPAFEYLPKCIMAAVVFYAGFGLLELDNFVFLVKIRAYLDIFLFFFTAILTLAVSIQVGVLASIGVSLGLVVKQATGPTFNVLGKAPDGKYKPIEDGIGIQTMDDVIIVRFKDSLFYAKIGFLRDRLRRVEKYRTTFVHPSEDFHHKPLAAVIFDISRMRTLDATALKLLCEITKAYIQKGIRVCFVRLSTENRGKFKRSGLIDLVGQGNFFSKIQHAVDSISAETGNRLSEYIPYQ